MFSTVCSNKQYNSKCTATVCSNKQYNSKCTVQYVAINNITQNVQYNI